MACSIDKSMQLKLIGLVAKNLTEAAKTPDTPFVLEKYITDFYNKSITRGLSPNKAAEYTQFIPTAVRKSIGLGDGSIMDIINTKEVRTLEKSFDNIANVQKMVKPGLTPKKVKDTLDSLTIEAQTTKTEPMTQEELNESSPYDYRKSDVYATSGQEGTKLDNGRFSDEKNPEEVFYYEFYDVFEEALRKQGGAASEVNIGGNTGFKLKIVKKTAIAIEDARPSEQRLVEGKLGLSAAEGLRRYNEGLGAVVTDNNGEILFFDENYNVVSQGEGKPIYHHLKIVKEQGGVYTFKGFNVQSPLEIATNSFTPSSSYPNLDLFKANNPTGWQQMINFAQDAQQAQLKNMYEVRKYLDENPTGNLEVEITGVNKGVFDIDFGIDTHSTSIDWAGGDMPFKPRVNKLGSKETGKVKSGLYVEVPGHKRAIPLQEDNLSPELVEDVLALMFDPLTYESGRGMKKVPGSERQKLINQFVYTHPGSIQIKTTNEKTGQWKPFFKGSSIDLTDEVAVKAAKDQITTHLLAKYVTKKNVVSKKYNTKDGRFNFQNDLLDTTFNDFAINEEGVLEIIPTPYNDYVKQHTSIKARPKRYSNGNNKIEALNGYFSFSTPQIPQVAEQPVLEEEIQTDQWTHNTEFDSEVNKDKKAYTLFKRNTGEKTYSTVYGKEIKIPGFEEYTFFIYKDDRNIYRIHEVSTGLLVPQEFETPRTIKAAKQVATEVLVKNRVHLEKVIANQPKLPVQDLADLTQGKEEIVHTKRISRRKSGTRVDRSKLYMDRIISMKSTPAEIKKAKEWFENSPLSKHIKYEELFNVVNSNAWAEFVDAGIKLYAGSDHTALYHEAFHAFTQHFLSKKQKQELYKELYNTNEGDAAVKKAATKLGKSHLDLTNYEIDLALEELAAEDFRQFMMTGKILGKTPKKKNIFKKILEFLKEVLLAMGGIMYVTHETEMLNNIYNQLRVGNLNEYTPSEKNVYFHNSALYKTIEPVEGQSTQINDQDALLLVQSMDSIMSEYIDKVNKEEGNTKFTSAIFTDSVNALAELYDIVEETFIKKQNSLVDEYETADEIDKESINKDIALLTDALDNFGDSVEGMIAFHMEKSPFISEQTKNIDQEAFQKTREDVQATRFEGGGADMSMSDLASNQVLYLVKSLKEYDSAGEPKLNRLGFTQLTDYKLSWVKIINTLSELDNSPGMMKGAMQEASKKLPWMSDLLDKLGAIDTKDASSFDLWTGFWQTFQMAEWKLFQVSVNGGTVTKDEQGNPIFPEWTITAGYASAVTRQVERDFNSHFKQIKGHAFIKDSKHGNRLSYNVLDKYKDNLAGNEFDFLHDIGIPLVDNLKTREGLKSVNVNWLYEKLVKLQNDLEAPVPIDSIIAVMRETYTREGQIIIKSESSNINKILDLQVKNSGLYSNSQVTTATGKTKHEQSQMSTVAVQVRAINQAATYDELVSQPHMAHLAYENNPSIPASNWMRALFEYNPNTKSFGKKREGVSLVIDDLSGSQTIIDGSYADYNYSTSTANADKYTRLLQDMYSGLLEGRLSTMVHADKSTTISMRVTTVNQELSSNVKHLYIDPKAFLQAGIEENTTSAMDQMFDILMPFLDGELKRIAKVKEHQEYGNMDNLLGFNVPDKKGNIRGMNLTVFQGVFTEETVKKIEEAGSVAALSNSLKEKMFTEMNEYFIWSTGKTKETLDEVLFLDKNMSNFLENSTGVELTEGKAKNLMIATYTLNVFIHHLNSLTVAYGDMAQFDMAKEEFHKRNAGIASTGRMFRTDKEAIDYVNDVMGKPFAEKHTGTKSSDFNTVLQTAILKENVVPSEMIPEYTEAIIAELVERGLSKAQAKKKAAVILDPYFGMEEGDGQGWISFDTYRILGKLSNRWSLEQEALFFKILNNPESVGLNEITEYFPARKYQYFGPLAVKGVFTTAFHKYSLFPMIPSVIKGKNMETLHENMMSQNIDYATFESGSKVAKVVADGAVEGDVLYSDVSSRTVDTAVTYTKNPIYLHYLKDQLDINFTFKGKVIFSTQLRKLIEDGLIEGGVPVDFKPKLSFNERRTEWFKLEPKSQTEKAKEASEKKKKNASPFYTLYKTYENTIRKYIEFRKEELRQELGSNEEELAAGTGDLTKLVKFIGKELDRQDLADHEIDFIKVNEKGQLVHDLSISLSANKIERSLNAIVNNRLVRQKVKGEALVQVATTLMESKNLELSNESTNDLKTYRLLSKQIAKDSQKNSVYLDATLPTDLSSLKKPTVKFKGLTLKQLVATDNPLEYKKLQKELKEEVEELNKLMSCLWA